MTETEIIEALMSKMAVPGGRHLYGVLGGYPRLAAFAVKLREARFPNGRRLPRPLAVNRGILDSIPDTEFRDLAQNEAKRPEPTAAYVARAFEAFLRSKLQEEGFIVLANLEMLFAYHLELNLLRTLAADQNRVLLLLPGRRERGRIVMFPEIGQESYTLPPNLIAENHLWELRS